VWVALRPEKIRLSKQPAEASRANQLRGTVHQLGYLGNRCTYQIKTASGKADHRVLTERAAHVGVVYRLERRGVCELECRRRGAVAVVNCI